MQFEFKIEEALKIILLHPLLCNRFLLFSNSPGGDTYYNWRYSVISINKYQKTHFAVKNCVHLEICIVTVSALMHHLGSFQESDELCQVL